MDAQMPEMDGFQTTAAIRKARRKRRARADHRIHRDSRLKATARRCLDAGMDGIPVQADPVEGAVRAVEQRIHEKRDYFISLNCSPSPISVRLAPHD